MSKEIIVENARNYQQNTGISFPGALLKTSILPIDLLVKHLPEEAKILDLGCGEGMFSNSLARALPKAEIHGIDLNEEKIKQAVSCKLKNAAFQAGNAKDFAFKNADAIIFNDVLHHNSYEEQKVLLTHATNLLKEGGLLILKEVDRKDRIDKFLTASTDRLLYPKDQLNFRDLEDWKALLATRHFEISKVHIMTHPYIASRTVIIAKKCPEPNYYVEGDTKSAVIDNTNGKLKVFLTGASGFIGHHMAKHLLEKGIDGSDVDLILLARTPIKLDPSLRDQANIIKGDLQSLDSIRHWELFDRIDYVFHFAAEVKISGVPDVLKRNNTEGTQHLLSVFKDRGLKRFIHASTLDVVDRQPHDLCKIPMNEETPPHPLTFYGETKLEAEKLVRGSGIPYSMIRIPWAFGIRMTPDTHVRNLLERVMHRSFVTRINFPGKMSMIAVEDLVNAFELAAFHPQALNEIFFVDGYPPISLGDLFKRMANASNVEAPKQIPIPKWVQYIIRTIRRFLPFTIQCLFSDVLCVDGTKIKNQLDFQPIRNLDDSLLKLSQWIQNHQDPKEKDLYIVSGAASGIGLELANQLAGRGKEVLLVDKNKEKLAQVAQNLNMPHLCLNLASSKGVKQLSEVMKQESNFYGLINCAGIGHRDSLIDTNSSKIDEIVALNISAVAKLSKEALKAFARQGEGILVNISSSTALQPFPYYSVYGASKAFVSSFTGAIRFEYRNHKEIRILDIVPSGTDTSFYTTAKTPTNPKDKLMSPEYVANRIIQIMENNSQNGTFFIGNKGKIMSLMARILPLNWNIKIWGYLVLKMR